MAVRAVRIERDQDMRPHATDVGGDLFARFQRVGTIELAVTVVEQRYLADAKLRRRRPQLGFARAADDFRTRRGSRIIVTATFSARGRYDVGPDALARVLRE